MVDTIIKIPVYNTKIRVVITDDFNKFAKLNEISEQDLSVYSAVCFNFFKYKRDFELIVIFKENPKYGEIVHEVFHLTCDTLRNVGCSLTEESEEAYAYLNEYLSKVIQNIVLKDKINNNSNK
jgi:hypothetical protein